MNPEDKGTVSTKISPHLYKGTRPHIPEDSTLYGSVSQTIECDPNLGSKNIPSGSRNSSMNLYVNAHMFILISLNH